VGKPLGTFSDGKWLKLARRFERRFRRLRLSLSSCLLALASVSGPGAGSLASMSIPSRIWQLFFLKREKERQKKRHTRWLYVAKQGLDGVNEAGGRLGHRYTVQTRIRILNPFRDVIDFHIATAAAP
jgi:hypothetical protein